MIGTLASRVTGLVRGSLLVQLFDPTVTDAFNIALKVPTLFRELLAEGALTNSFIPAYRALPPDEAKRLVSALFSLLLVVNAMLQLALVWAAPTVVGWLVAESNKIDVPLTIAMTRAVFPFLAAISFAALAMGILNAEERFFAPAWGTRGAQRGNDRVNAALSGPGTDAGGCRSRWVARRSCWCSCRRSRAPDCCRVWGCGGTPGSGAYFC